MALLFPSSKWDLNLLRFGYELNTTSPPQTDLLSENYSRIWNFDLTSPSAPAQDQTSFPADGFISRLTVIKHFFVPLFLRDVHSGRKDLFFVENWLFWHFSGFRFYLNRDWPIFFRCFFFNFPAKTFGAKNRLEIFFSKNKTQQKVWKKWIAFFKLAFWLSKKSISTFLMTSFKLEGCLLRLEPNLLSSQPGQKSKIYQQVSRNDSG